MKSPDEPIFDLRAYIRAVTEKVEEAQSKLPSIMHLEYQGIDEATGDIYFLNCLNIVPKESTTRLTSLGRITNHVMLSQVDEHHRNVLKKLGME